MDALPAALHPLLAWLPMAWLADPLALALGLALLTLLLEDAAIAAGIALALAGSLSWTVAGGAVAGGIAAGDLMLYGMGAAALRVPALARRVEAAPRADRARELLHRNLTLAVAVARVVPGLRLAVYTAAGALSLPFSRFAALVALAVAAWTGALFALGAGLGAVLAPLLGLPGWALALAAFVPLALLPTLLSRRKGQTP